MTCTKCNRENEAGSVFCSWCGSAMGQGAPQGLAGGHKMEMKLCSNNHYYDSSVHVACPYCVPNDGAIGVTMPASPAGGTAMGGKTSMGHTAPKDSERTQAAIKVQTGIDPVVGWLICIEGKEKGRDFRIRSDNNFIGRGENMDIVIRDDETVSRENHAIVTYDSREKVFYFAPGSGRGIVRLNDSAVLSTVRLEAYDRVEIGNTKLMFMPLCGEVFDWSE